MPANGGLLRMGGRSPGSPFGRFQGEIANSLPRIIEIFPFLGDGDRRLSSICTVWPTLQCNARKFSLSAATDCRRPFLPSLAKVICVQWTGGKRWEH
jgi:hypothetical protein